MKLFLQDCLANDYFDNVDKSPEQKLCTATDESDDALSNYSVTTTESDHRELLRLIKRRKQDKFKAARMTRSGKEYQKKKLSAELLQDTILSDDDTTEMKTKKSEGSSVTMLKRKEDNYIESTSPSKLLDENIMRQSINTVWAHLQVNGGYQVKINGIRVPSKSNYYPVVVDVTNSSGQMNIYIKARTFIEVLKGFVHEAKRQFHDIAHEVNLPFFFDVIQNSEYVDVRKVPYGANEYKAGYVNNREYKDHHMLFMFPKEKGDLKDIIEKFNSFLFKVFSSSLFFLLMESYTKLIPNQGGDIGKHIRMKDSDAWKILKKRENYQIVWLDALDAKLMDEDINRVLEKMFPNESHKDAYQKIGWKNKLSTPWIKMEKLSSDGA